MNAVKVSYIIASSDKKKWLVMSHKLNKVKLPPQGETCHVLGHKQFHYNKYVRIGGLCDILNYKGGMC